ncbi:protein-L-isoaspartate O-methyltransferase family protein [Rhizobium sp. RAF56]|uniref:protein-L-isoaspartate O-methyltransferase family protein n=1 Tax=Rhizobium sp. RAF56 TaxID=3233062 RepID=UPI003F9E1C7B
MREAELQSLRQVYARKIVASANASGDARLEAAFAAVHREDFLGSPPWRPIDTGRGSRSAPVSDPACVYQDVLFPLSLARGVNNGSPSLHARLMHALAPQPGQTIVHLGAGTGYYSAILSELVGPEGQVAAIEIDPLLADKARTCLADRQNIRVMAADAGLWPEEATDRIYVSFAGSAPMPLWIERLAPGARLVLPLGVPDADYGFPRFSHGEAFMFERRQEGFSASRLCSVAFVQGEGLTQPGNRGDLERLRQALSSPGADAVRSLVWGREADERRCWFWSPQWSLCYDPV